MGCQSKLSPQDILSRYPLAVGMRDKSLLLPILCVVRAGDFPNWREIFS